MDLTDPRTTPRVFYARWVEPLLNDPRDVVFVGLMAQCAAVACVGLALFFVDVRWVIAAPLYIALNFLGVIDRYTLMLHCTSHRPLFRRHVGFLNHVIPWFLAPFFGQTPNTYFAHHMGMHHREENLEGDLSSTMPFRRDRPLDWLRYWSRFFFFGIVELAAYLRRRGQSKLLRRVLIGEIGFWLAVALLARVRPMATLVVFVTPIVVMRLLMMMGNWAQHAFVAEGDPENPYHSSITCINTRYNRRCFNDGYHALHHVRPNCHYTEHPIEFEKNLAEYARQDAIVFDGIDFFQVWVLLMLGAFATLADRFVQLPGAKVRSKEERIAFLKSRLNPLPARTSQEESALPA